MAYFSAFGAIDDLTIMTDPQTGNTRGFGFVSFNEPDSAEAALNMGRMHTVDGKMVELKRAEPRGAKGGKGKGKGGKGGKGGMNNYGAGQQYGYPNQAGQFFQAQYGNPQYGAQGGYGAQQPYGGKGGDMGAYAAQQGGYQAYPQTGAQGAQNIGYGYGQGGYGAAGYGYGQGGAGYPQGAAIGYAAGGQDFSQGYGAAEGVAAQSAMDFQHYQQAQALQAPAAASPTPEAAEVTTEAVMATLASSQFPAAPGSGSGTLH